MLGVEITSRLLSCRLTVTKVQVLQIIHLCSTWIRLFAKNWEDETLTSDSLYNVTECDVHLKGSVERSLLPSAIFLTLHETGLESLKITSARSFFIEMSKERLKAKEHHQFRGVLGHWRTAAIDRTTFHACQRCRKRPFSQFFSWLWGVIWRGKAFRDQQCQFLTRNKSLSSENESNCSMTSECVRTGLVLPRGAGREHGRC